MSFSANIPPTLPKITFKLLGFKTQETPLFKKVFIEAIALVAPVDVAAAEAAAFSAASAFLAKLREVVPEV